MWHRGIMTEPGTVFRLSCGDHRQQDYMVSGDSSQMVLVTLFTAGGGGGGGRAGGGGGGAAIPMEGLPPARSVLAAARAAALADYRWARAHAYLDIRGEGGALAKKTQGSYYRTALCGEAMEAEGEHYAEFTLVATSFFSRLHSTNCVFVFVCVCVGVNTSRLAAAAVCPSVCSFFRSISIGNLAYFGSILTD